MPGVRDLLRADVWDFEEYGAPEPLEEFAARQGVAIDQVDKLDQNENPYGCSPKVREALAACDLLSIYPDPLARRSRALLEEYVGIGRERIVVGNGSDELIEVLFRLFLRPGDRVMSFTPTFGYYPTVAATCAAEYVGLPRRADWSIDVEAALEALAEDDRAPERRTKIVIVTSPNNPTGSLTALGDVERLLSTGRLVVVDEAYFEFAGQTALPLASDYDNLVILRTFSKWAGLAGVRIGYGVFPEWLLAQVFKFKPPYGLSVTGQVALEASLADRAYLRTTVDRMIAERGRLSELLAATGLLRVYPSAANFVLTELAEAVGTLTAASVRRRLEDRQILVRAYSDPRLRRAIRFSVGRPEQTDRLVNALREIGRG